MIKKIFLAKQHLKQDFLQRFLAKQPRIIHGSHGEHRKRFCLKIILKILIHKQRRAESPMISLAQGNTLRKSAFWSRIFIKDYIPLPFNVTQKSQKRIYGGIFKIALFY